MTLDDLIKAVEEGDDDAVKQIILRMSSAAHDKGEDFPSVDISFAYYRNRLDAAKAVHDALLPGWEWNIDKGDGAYVENRGDFGLEYTADIPGMPARAWLLAILKAKQAEGRG